MRNGNFDSRVFLIAAKYLRRKNVQGEGAFICSDKNQLSAAGGHALGLGNLGEDRITPLQSLLGVT